MSGIYGRVPSIDGGSVIGVIVLVAVVYLLLLALSVAMYILQSLGLYTVADRRGIKHPWMAWLPITNMWILGSIADQYQYVAKGQIRSRRKVILVLSIVMVVLTLVLVGCYLGLIVNFFINLRELDYMFEDQAWSVFMAPLLSMLGVCGVMEIIAIILTVFQYIAYYNLFASCDPEHKTLFTVLGILFSFTLPFFVFASRKKDLGMPPRKDAVVAENPTQNPIEPTAEYTEE